MKTSAPSALLGAGLILGACSSSGPKTAIDAQCQREAENTPHVRALIAQSVPGTYNLTFDKSVSTPPVDAQFALRQAKLECLRRHGVPDTGVEPVRNYGFSPLGY